MSSSSSSSGSPALAGDIITLEKARGILNNSVQRMKSGTYSTTKIDDAIKAAGNEFIRRTACNVRWSAERTLSEDGTDVAVPANVSVPDVSLVEYRKPSSDIWREIKLANYQAVRRVIDDHGEGRPLIAAFERESKLIVGPVADQDYTLRMRFNEQFVRFESGTSDPDEIVINIPYEAVHGVLWWGALAMLEHTRETVQFQREAMGRFEQHIRNNMGRTDAKVASVMANERAYD